MTHNTEIIYSLVVLYKYICRLVVSGRHRLGLIPFLTHVLIASGKPLQVFSVAFRVCLSDFPKQKN